METKELSIKEREAILLNAIQQYERDGFHLVEKTETTARMVRPKQFNLLVALLALFVIVIGLIIYILFYIAEKDQYIYIDVDSTGKVNLHQ